MPADMKKSFIEGQSARYLLENTPTGSARIHITLTLRHAKVRWQRVGVPNPSKEVPSVARGESIANMAGGGLSRENLLSFVAGGSCGKQSKVWYQTTEEAVTMRSKLCSSHRGGAALSLLPN